MWLTQRLRDLMARGLQFAADTINIVRYSYLFTYIVVGLIGSCVAGYFGFYTLAPALAWLAFVICAMLSYAFGARLILGASAYKILRRVTQTFGGSATSAPDLLNVWYWQAFVAMWASLPLVALAVLRPWEGGRTLQLIAVTFMILHVVATQRGVGRFWRRIYAGCSVAVVAIVILAIVNPGDWARISGSHQRGQKLAFSDEGYHALVASKLEPQLRTIEGQLAQIVYDENQDIAAGRSGSAVQQAHKQNLEAARDNIKSQINTMTSSASIDLSDEAAIFRMGILLIMIVVLLGGSISFVRGMFSAKTSSTTAAH